MVIDRYPDIDDKILLLMLIERVNIKRNFDPRKDGKNSSGCSAPIAWK
jgi:hypothetical protein